MDWLWGGLVAIAGGILGIWFGSHNESKQWLREQRRLAYVEVFAAVANFRLLLGKGDLRPSLEWDTAKLRYAVAFASLQVVGPREVADAAEPLGAQFDAGQSGDVAAFSDAVQKVMKTGKP
jgi:hypothetical protein